LKFIEHWTFGHVVWITILSGLSKLVEVKALPTERKLTYNTVSSMRYVV